MNNLVHRSKLFLDRNASTILTTLGGVGVVVTAVMTAKATPKAMRLVEKAEEEKGEELTKLEVVKAGAIAYVPAVIVGASTIGCIFGANVLNKRHQAALTSAYALLDSSYKDYRRKVEELYGEDADIRVRDELAADKYEETDIQVEDNKILFFDEFSRRYFESTMEQVLKAEYNLNRELSMHCSVTLNQFYEFLGIPKIEAGDSYGWSSDSNFECYWQEWVDFHHRTVLIDDDLECCVISMFSEPMLDYYDY